MSGFPLPGGPLDGAGGQALAQSLFGNNNQNQTMNANMSALLNAASLEDYRKGQLGLKQAEWDRQNTALQGLQSDPTLQQYGLGDTAATMQRAGLDASVQKSVLDQVMSAHDKQSEGETRLHFNAAVQQALDTPNPDGSSKLPEQAVAEVLRLAKDDKEWYPRIARMVGGTVEDLQKLTDWTTEMAASGELNTVAPYIMDGIHSFGEMANSDKGTANILRHPELAVGSLRKIIRDEITEDAKAMAQAGTLPPMFNGSAEAYTHYMVARTDNAMNRVMSPNTGKKNHDPMGMIKTIANLGQVTAETFYKNSQADAIPDKVKIDQQNADTAEYRAHNPSTSNAWSPPAVAAKKDVAAFVQGLKPQAPTGAKTTSSKRNQIKIGDQTVVDSVKTNETVRQNVYSNRAAGSALEEARRRGLIK